MTMIDSKQDFIQELQEATDMMRTIVEKGVNIYKENRKLCHIQIYHNQAIITGPLWFKVPEVIVEYENVDEWCNILRWGLIVRALEKLEQDDYLNGTEVRIMYNPHCGTVNILE